MEDPALQTYSYNLAALDEAGRICQELERHHVPVLLLKGAAILEEIYPDLSCRRMTDIDLLVREKDADKARDLFLGQGYEQIKGLISFAFVKKLPSPFYLDLHTGLPFFNENETWAEARSVRVHTRQAKTLSLENTLIHLCYHAVVGHAFVSEQKLEDIHRFIERHGRCLSWEKAAGLIISRKIKAPAYWCLLKVRERYNNTVLPDGFLKKIRPHLSLISLMCWIISQSKAEIPRAEYVISALMPGHRGLAGRIFTRYHGEYGSFAKYLIRPLMLSGKGVRGCLELLRSTALQGVPSLLCRKSFF